MLVYLTNSSLSAIFLVMLFIYWVAYNTGEAISCIRFIVREFRR